MNQTKLRSDEQLFPVRRQGTQKWTEAPGVTAGEAAKTYAKSLPYSGALGLPVIVEVGLGLEGVKRYRVDRVSFYRAMEVRG